MRMEISNLLGFGEPKRIKKDGITWLPKRENDTTLNSEGPGKLHMIRSFVQHVKNHLYRGLSTRD